MNKTVAIVSTKGGVGKTMVATNLAVASAHAGQKVLVVNTDQQQSAVYWGHHRKQQTGLPVIDVQQWTTERGDIHKSVSELVGWDQVIIDVRGTDSRELRSALLAAEVVIVPTTPSLEDFEVLKFETIPLLNRVAKDFPAKNWAAKILINSWSLAIHLHRDVIGFMEQMQSDYDFFDTKLRRLADYQSARAVGMGVIEYDRRSKAAKDFQEFYQEVIKL